MLLCVMSSLIREDDEQMNVVVSYGRMVCDLYFEWALWLGVTKSKMQYCIEVALKVLQVVSTSSTL